MSSEIMLETGIATVVAMLGGILAVIAAGGDPTAHRRRLLALVSLAAGALLAVTLVSILPEARENLSLPGLLFAVASGYTLYYLIGRFVFPICPACASSHIDEHSAAHVHSEACSHSPHTPGHEVTDSPSQPAKNFRSIATLLGVIVAVHAAIDGIAIASGHHMHAPAGSPNLASAAQALPLLFALSLHKLPEGLALTALLMSSGFRRTPAFLLTAGIEMATLLGGALGIMLRDVASPALLSGIMAHVGGGFLYLAFQALRGDADEIPRTRKAGFSLPQQAVYGCAGFLVVSLILWTIHLLPNAH